MNRWICFGGGLMVGGIAGYVIKTLLDKRQKEDDAQRLADAIDEKHRYIETCKSELDDVKFELQQLFEAVEIFCDENTRGNIFDLVNTRLNVRMMQQQGLPEEEITDHMVRHKLKDLIGELGYLSESVIYAQVGNELLNGLQQGLKNGNPEWEAEFSEKVEVILCDVSDSKTPYLISEDEYVRASEEFDQEVLTYYALDDTLADEDDDIVPQSTVGTNNLNAFESSDIPAIFVRNESLMIEYEIIWEDTDTYQSIVLGAPSAPRNQRIFRKEET